MKQVDHESHTANMLLVSIEMRRFKCTCTVFVSSTSEQYTQLYNVILYISIMPSLQ